MPQSVSHRQALAAPKKRPSRKKGGGVKTLQQRTRALALQGVYSWLLNQASTEEIAAQVLGECTDASSTPQNHQEKNVQKKPSCNVLFFYALLEGVLTNAKVLQEILEPHLDRSWEKISPTIQAILLLGTYELRYESVTPIQVILNEAVELARSYSSDDAYRYINGVLEQCAANVRQEDYAEMKQPVHARRTKV